MRAMEIDNEELCGSVVISFFRNKITSCTNYNQVQVHHTLFMIKRLQKCHERPSQQLPVVICQIHASLGDTSSISIIWVSRGYIQPHSQARPGDKASYMLLQTMHAISKALFCHLGMSHIGEIALIFPLNLNDAN